MKKILFVALCALLVSSACTRSDDVDKNNVVARGLLTGFAVTAGSSYYNAVIDHYAGTVKIGSIKNLDEIDGVDYTLAFDDATILPDPSTFIGNWAKEQTIVVAHAGVETAYSVIFTRYKEPTDDPDEPADPDAPGWDYPWHSDFLPKDDETQLYKEPYVPFTAATMPVGAAHPNATLAAAGWKLYTVNEFTDGVTATKSDGSETILPHGLHPFNTQMMNESAIVRNEECARIEDGHLIMEAHRLSEPVNTGFSNDNNPSGVVDYEHASFRAYPKRNAQLGDWFTLHTHMRFEVRYRRTNTQGFNNAVWFQGNVQTHPEYPGLNQVPWPDYGEIDLLENPKQDANSQVVHFTLHCGAYYSGLGNARTITLPLDDLTHWNIFWMELYPEKVVMGVNGRQTLVVTKGANDTTFARWPWDQEDGFYLILSTGMYDRVRSSRNSWAGAVRPADFEDPDNLPTMEFDWVRVYVNDDYNGEEAMNIFY